MYYIHVALLIANIPIVHTIRFCCLHRNETGSQLSQPPCNPHILVMRLPSDLNAVSIFYSPQKNNNINLIPRSRNILIGGENQSPAVDGACLRIAVLIVPSAEEPKSPGHHWVTQPGQPLIDYTPHALCLARCHCISALPLVSVVAPRED
ncbi:hypothetical protein BGW36DRAFT_199172 [Talaromyces proteolyticus]|uniref:Uncharacterized protein n=1 Tax=Talaromyces proteolyticus TaxID=1131652 RepID=A0AAD4PZ26_9EURO|nr:uncharacterized protein BGW36DRAFT_199172 [Talaromyces proteolyticus]KAH8695234.1 hypothetical protein BGW36DRAFT_199172 [Talaromyces proteolyticus]